MINIVHAFFPADGRRGHTFPALLVDLVVTGLLVAPPMLPLGVAASPVASGRAEPPFIRAACDPRVDCPGRRPPGPPDRDVRPFDGTLGRPCGYRWRFTPPGARRVRVCY